MMVSEVVTIYNNEQFLYVFVLLHIQTVTIEIRCMLLFLECSCSRAFNFIDYQFGVSWNIYVSSNCYFQFNNYICKCYYSAFLLQNQIPNASPDLATLDVKTNIVCPEGQVDLNGQCGESSHKEMSLHYSA